MTKQRRQDLIVEYCGSNMSKLRSICMPLILRKGVAEMEFDDLLSDAQKVFLETLDSYKEEENDNFAAYLVSNIKRSYLDWTRDRMRAKRCNYARDRYGRIVTDEEGNRVILRNVTLDTSTQEGRDVCEKTASDFRVEVSVMRENREEWNQPVKEYLEALSPLQRRILFLLAESHDKREICEILHITDSHYDNSYKRMMADERIKPLRPLAEGKNYAVIKR